jgi:hypothetical protein
VQPVKEKTNWHGKNILKESYKKGPKSTVSYFKMLRYSQGQKQYLKILITDD